MRRDADVADEKKAHMRRLLDAQVAEKQAAAAAEKSADVEVRVVILCLACCGHMLETSGLCCGHAGVRGTCSMASSSMLPVRRLDGDIVHCWCPQAVLVC